MPPTRYLRQVRLERAREDLRQLNGTAADIATGASPTSAVSPAPTANATAKCPPQPSPQQGLGPSAAGMNWQFGRR